MKKDVTMLVSLSVLLGILLFFTGCNNHTDSYKLSSGNNDHEYFRKTEGSRQVHLDFHTSEAFDSIGFAFSKEQFQKALKVGKVNSINIFAKGHHGWNYYPTEIGKMHPGLKFDLFGQQLEACHEMGVRAQAYFTIGWSVRDARLHPEWTRLDRNGSNWYKDMVKKLKPGERMRWGWDELIPEGEYLQNILAQTEELVKKYDIDGVWYDIVHFDKHNFNEASKKDMLERGIDLDDWEAVNKRHVEKMELFLSKTNEIIKKYRPNASIFYNWSTGTDGNSNTIKYKFHKYNTKQDLEDLPTAWGGYDIFPWRAKFFANTGKPIVAMSGKFHKSWGEFGGFKHKDAILYEAALMVAFGAATNFGDQLHPSGLMEMATYENIGYAFDYVEKIEEYGVGANHSASTGLYLSLKSVPDNGVVRMLLERQVNFVVVNNLERWADLETIIITSDGIRDEDISRIESYLKNGGKILAMGTGILNEDKGEFLIDIGGEYLGKARYDVDYTMVKEKVSDGLVVSPFLNYTPALRIKPGEGAEVLAAIREPYFSRTLNHYTSHANTPYKLEDAAHPAIIKSGNVVYIAHDLDKQYYQHGARVHRDLFYNALQQLRNNPQLSVEMPSSGRINFLRQPEHNRYVAHLLYGPPIQRGSVKVIEDLVSMQNVPVSVKIPEKIKRAYLIPSGEELNTSMKNGRIEVLVPEFKCHIAVVFEY